MKKVLLVVAAAAAAAFASSKYQEHTASQDLWKQVSDQPGGTPPSGSGTAG